MQRTETLRSTFDRSRLVRLLDAWIRVDPEPGGMDLAERASLWFGPLDAIRLQAAHQALRAIQAPMPRQPREPPPGDAHALASEVQRVRTALSRAIAQDPLAQAATVDFAGYQRRHLELQRLMEMTIAALRGQLRQALARVSAPLRQLAALDEAMEQLLAAREQALLPAAAALLEHRFVALRPAAGEPADAPALRAPGGWLHAFEADWRRALLCELDLRLEPVLGLLEALAHDTEIQR